MDGYLTQLGPAAQRARARFQVVQSPLRGALTAHRSCFLLQGNTCQKTPPVERGAYRMVPGEEDGVHFFHAHFQQICRRAERIERAYCVSDDSSKDTRYPL